MPPHPPNCRTLQIADDSLELALCHGGSHLDWLQAASLGCAPPARVRSAEVRPHGGTCTRGEGGHGGSSHRHNVKTAGQERVPGTKSPHLGVLPQRAGLDLSVGALLGGHPLASFRPAYIQTQGPGLGLKRQHDSFLLSFSPLPPS